MKGRSMTSAAGLKVNAAATATTTTDIVQSQRRMLPCSGWTISFNVISRV